MAFPPSPFDPFARRGSRTRACCLLLLAAVLLLAGWAPAVAQSDPTPSVQLVDQPLWAVALRPAALHSQPDDGSDEFSTLRPLAPLQILGYAGDWAYVYNPRTKGTAFVKGDALGPGDPPSAYAEKI